MRVAIMVHSGEKVQGTVHVGDGACVACDAVIQIDMQDSG